MGEGERLLERRGTSRFELRLVLEGALELTSAEGGGREAA